MPRMRRLAIALLASAALALSLGAAPAAAQLPVVYNGLLGYSHTSPSASPPGANDWSCRPSAAHPRPSSSCTAPSPTCRTAGRRSRRCWRTTATASSRSTTAPTAAAGSSASTASATSPNRPAQLAAFVDRVLDATGAGRVDLVGHSQGGMMPRYYLKYLRGAAKVRTLVGLSPSNHGTTLDGLFTLGGLLPRRQRPLRLLSRRANSSRRVAVPDRPQRRRRYGRPASPTR